MRAGMCSPPIRCSIAFGASARMDLGCSPLSDQPEATENPRAPNPVLAVVLSCLAHLIQEFRKIVDRTVVIAHFPAQGQMIVFRCLSEKSELRIMLQRTKSEDRFNAEALATERPTPNSQGPPWNRPRQGSYRSCYSTGEYFCGAM